MDWDVQKTWLPEQSAFAAHAHAAHDAGRRIVAADSPRKSGFQPLSLTHDGHAAAKALGFCSVDFCMWTLEAGLKRPLPE